VSQSRGSCIIDKSKFAVGQLKKEWERGMASHCVSATGARNDFHIPQQLKPLSQGENPIKFGSERNKSELSAK